MENLTWSSVKFSITVNWVSIVCHIQLVFILSNNWFHLTNNIYSEPNFLEITGITKLHLNCTYSIHYVGIGTFFYCELILRILQNKLFFRMNKIQKYTFQYLYITYNIVLSCTFLSENFMRMLNYISLLYILKYIP